MQNDHEPTPRTPAPSMHENVQTWDTECGCGHADPSSDWGLDEDDA